MGARWSVRRGAKADSWTLDIGPNVHIELDNSTVSNLAIYDKDNSKKILEYWLCSNNLSL